MLLSKILQHVTLQTSSRWRAGSHQRLWRVCPHPRFPGGSYRSCSLAQRHLGQRWQKYTPKNPLLYCITCITVCVYWCVSLPVALAYTTLARGSLFCRSSTAFPIFVDVAFLALWHSSKIICNGERSRANNADMEYQFLLINCWMCSCYNERIQLRQSLACTNLGSV